MLQWTPEMEELMLLWVLKRGGMWLSKVSRRAFKSNAISNIFIRFCIRCNYLYGAWLFRFSRKWKGWKPLIRLGFQPLLSSVKVGYFLLFSDMLDCLENRLPKSHGGSHTAGTEYTTRNRVFAVSASRGDVGLNLYRSGTISTNLTPSSIPLFQARLFFCFFGTGTRGSVAAFR